MSPSELASAHHGVISFGRQSGRRHGGASGIGRAIVQKFAGSGACVRIMDIDLKQAEAVALEVVRSEGNASAFQRDVASRESVKAVFDQLFRKEAVHILVNNAGISHVGSQQYKNKVSDIDRKKKHKVKEKATDSYGQTWGFQKRYAEIYGLAGG